MEEKFEYYFFVPLFLLLHFHFTFLLILFYWTRSKFFTQFIIVHFSRKVEFRKTGKFKVQTKQKQSNNIHNSWSIIKVFYIESSIKSYPSMHASNSIESIFSTFLLVNSTPSFRQKHLFTF